MKIVRNSIEFSVIRIPDELRFDELNLLVDSDSGTLKFDWAPLRKIVELNAEVTLDSDAAVIDLIGA